MSELVRNPEDRVLMTRLVLFILLFYFLLLTAPVPRIPVARRAIVSSVAEKSVSSENGSLTPLTTVLMGKSVTAQSISVACYDACELEELHLKVIHSRMREYPFTFKTYVTADCLDKTITFMPAQYVLPQNVYKSSYTN